MAVLYSICDREECDSALLMLGRLKKQNVEIVYRQERILSVTACGREILDVYNLQSCFLQFIFPMIQILNLVLMSLALSNLIVLLFSLFLSL